MREEEMERTRVAIERRKDARILELEAEVGRANQEVAALRDSLITAQDEIARFEAHTLNAGYRILELQAECARLRAEADLNRKSDFTI